MFADISITSIVIIVGTLLISLGFHEAMHAFAAHALGDDTAKVEGRLTLNPFKHIDILTTIVLPTVLLLSGLPPILAAKPVPFNPFQVRYGDYGAALVGLAGPFTNLALAVIAALMINFGMFGGGASDVVSLFIWINIGIFVFNLIPLPPLDGSRVLYAFAPEPVRAIMDRMEHFGIIIILMIFILLSPIFGPVLFNIDQAIFEFLIR